MTRFLTIPILLLALLATSCLGAYPYDSVAELMVKQGNGYNGGSGTLIAVSDTMGLILTCRHVVLTPGNIVKVHWAATGEITTGKVVKVGQTQDIALVICPRPRELRPVPHTMPTYGRRIINAGYPGVKGVLEWQEGQIKSLTDSQVFYTCRPIPGMSGGVTFDKFGNLVGVITHYQPNGGISSSGVQMIKFIGEFLEKPVRVWDLPGCQCEEGILPGVLEQQITQPSDPYAFRLFLWFNYTGPASGSWSTPLYPLRYELEVLEEPTHQIERLAA